MTSEQIELGQWRLSFSEPEADFIINTLAQMGKHYQEDLAQMSPALRAYWQGTLTREAASTDDLRESQEVLSEARNELRSERLVPGWKTGSGNMNSPRNRDPWKVVLSGAERDEIHVAMLNDRRMHLAHDLGITEADMETDLARIANEPRRL